MRMCKRALFLVLFGVLFAACLPYQDPDKGVLYSCEIDEDCAPDYTCSGIISVEKDGDQECDNDAGSISVIEQGDLCYYPYCRRSQDSLKCGNGVCALNQNCVIVKEVGLEFTRAACVTQPIDSHESGPCKDDECAENETCVLDQRGWAEGDPAYQKQDEAWRCVSGVEEVQTDD